MLSFEEFDTLHNFFRVKSDTPGPYRYWVPEILVGGSSPRRLVDVGNPYRFYLNAMDTIVAKALTIKREANLARDLSSNECIYQSFIRTFASLNGEIGTALKQIAFLPFLQKHLGITIFISLPTGAIGTTNQKGRRGSPFATKNPFDIDNSLSDPLLPGFSPLFQYKALMQACHKLSIRTGSIVPLATLSIDSHLFKLFPDLGFWWIAEAGEVLFCEQMSAMKDKKEYCDFTIPSPQLSIEAKRRFVLPPSGESVKIAIHNDQAYYVATIVHKGKTHSITLANSFPDVIADDWSTYSWKDVSTINYTNQHYPAPLGIRNEEKYEPSQPAWKLMPFVLAWRVWELGEEVFLIDVNRSVPEGILVQARQLVEIWKGSASTRLETIFTHKAHAESVDKLLNLQSGSIENIKQVHDRSNPTYIHFIGEDLWSFDITSSVVKTVVGPLIFCVSAHTHNHPIFVESLRYHLKILETRKSNNMFLAGVANHDTMPPRPNIASLLYVIYYFLPNSIPLIFSGTEFYAQVITNKEFGFDTSPELLRLRKELDDNSLGLFNDYPMDWSALPEVRSDGAPIINMCQLLNSLYHLRNKIVTPELQGYHFIWLPPDEQETDCFGYIRFSINDDRDAIILCANWNLTDSRVCVWPYASARLLLSVNAYRIPSLLKRGEEFIMAPCSLVLFTIGKLQQPPHFTIEF